MGMVHQHGRQVRQNFRQPIRRNFFAKQQHAKIFRWRAQKRKRERMEDGGWKIEDGKTEGHPAIFHPLSSILDPSIPIPFPHHTASGHTASRPRHISRGASGRATAESPPSSLPSSPTE